jgi:hypothetical protein
MALHLYIHAVEKERPELGSRRRRSPAGFGTGGGTPGAYAGPHLHSESDAYHDVQ